jgi:tyrosyl-tRNA synthetase
LTAALLETAWAKAAEGATYAELFEATGLVPSRSGARRAVAEGGAYVNNGRLDEADASPAAADWLHGRWLVLRRGKRAVAGVERAT